MDESIFPDDRSISRVHSPACHACGYRPLPRVGFHIATMAATWESLRSRRFPFIDGEPVPKQNYHQARKQKELARKARQQEKLQRRSARQGTTGDSPEPPAEVSVSESTAGDAT